MLKNLVVKNMNIFHTQKLLIKKNIFCLLGLKILKKLYKNMVQKNKNIGVI